MLSEVSCQSLGGGGPVRPLQPPVGVPQAGQGRLPAHQGGQAAKGVQEPVGQPVGPGGLQKGQGLGLGEALGAALFHWLRVLIVQPRQGLALGGVVQPHPAQAVQNPPGERLPHRPRRLLRLRSSLRRFLFRRTLRRCRLCVRTGRDARLRRKGNRIRREPPLQPQRAVLRHQNAEAHTLLSVVRVQADDALRLHAALRRNMPVKPPPFRRSAPHGRAAVKNRIFHIKQPPA